MRVKLFADLAEAAGSGELDVEVPDGAPVTDALDALFETYPALADRVLEDGELREHVNVLKNGDPVADPDEASVEAGDELALFPPVSGG